MNSLIAIKEIESVRKLHAQMDSLVISNIQRISNNNVTYILLEYKIKERPPNLLRSMPPVREAPDLESNR